MNINVQNISFYRKNSCILKDISFAAQSGEVTVVLGPNGSGKSTLLGIVAGDLLPKTGEVTYDNQPLDQILFCERARMRAFMMQKSSIWADLSVNNVVALGRLPYQPHESDSDSLQIARDVLTSQKNEELLDRQYRYISHGEQQRVDFSRITAQICDAEKSVVLLDEPSASLDVKHQILLLNHACALTNNGATLIVAMHDLNLAARYADRILLLMNGKLVASGSVKETLTEKNLEMVYRTEFHVLPHPETQTSIFIPRDIQSA